MGVIANGTETGTVSVGQYLAARLRELGVGHVFGIPGDFSLALIDELLAVEGLEWVGTANELNAAYAADGYARLRRGVGVVATTYGVGELAAINGIAGSFTESVPVVHIVGMPTIAQQASGAILHHSLADGDFRHFVRAQAEVTVSAVVVGTVGATSIIDRALLTAVNSSKPVYLGIPADIAVMKVSCRPLDRPLRPQTTDPEHLQAFATRLANVIGEAQDVRMLVGPLVHRRALEPLIRSIAGYSDVYIATQSASRAILPRTHPADLGVYAGVHTESSRTHAMIDEAQPLILAGAVLSDFLTGFFTHRFDPDAAIALELDSARIGQETFDGICLADALTVLSDVVAARGIRKRDAVFTQTASSPRAKFDSEDLPLNHANLWPRVQEWVRPGSTVVAEAGTAFYGVVNMPLPDDCEVLAQPVWSSIGYTIPATFGATVGRPEREAVLIIGDGSAQLTIQELPTMIHRGQTPTIILLENRGYTVERLIRSPEAPYQDIVPWNWCALAAAFGFPPDRIFTAATESELDHALHAATGTAPTFVHVVLPRDDAPGLLTRIAVGVR